LTSVQHEKLLDMMIGKLLGRTDKRQ
jgi:hypothetical protein